MDKEFLEKKGLLESVNRYRSIMEYVSPYQGLEEDDANMDGLDDATGMAAGADPGMGAAPAPGAPAAGAPGAAPAGDPGMGAAPGAGAAPADPAATGQGAPGFDPQGDIDVEPTAQDSLTDTGMEAPDAGANEGDEVIDVDELVDGMKRNEDAVEKLTGKFDEILGKFQEFQGELKANTEFMAKLQGDFEKRNPTSVEKMTMRSLQSKPFQETPEEYMANDAPENYSPEDDNNGVGQPQYTITRDDVRNATDYDSIAKTLRDNGNASLKNLLGL